MEQHNRRSFFRTLLGGIALGALFISDRIANAASNVTTYANGASGSSVRTLLNRLLTRYNDIYNVKSWGAVGNGIADDTAAIQAAVDAAIAVGTGPFGGGTIYFPMGTYKITSPIDFSTDAQFSILFKGEGFASQLIGNFNGYILDRNQSNGVPGLRRVENLYIKNIHATGGGIRLLGNDVGQVAYCSVQAHNGILLGQNQPSDTCFDSSVMHCVLNGLNSPYDVGSTGIVAGPETAVIGCAVVNFERGIVAYGQGVLITSCRIEVNHYGIVLGKDFSDNSFSVSGGFLSALSMESNYISIWVSSAVATTIAGCSIQGDNIVHDSNAAIEIASCNTLNILDMTISGTFDTAGFYLQGQPTRLSLDGVISTSWSFGAGVVKGNVQRIGHGNCPALDTAFGDLAGLVSNNINDGYEVLISNANTGTFGAAVTTTGAFRVRARYSTNSSAWLVCGLAT